MTASQLQILGIVLILCGVATLVVSQLLLRKWHKKSLNEV